VYIWHYGGNIPTYEYAETAGIGGQQAKRVEQRHKARAEAGNYGRNVVNDQRVGPRSVGKPTGCQTTHGVENTD